MIDDVELADEIIRRLNKLCEKGEVKEVLGGLITLRAPVPEFLHKHPTIQVVEKGAPGSGIYELGFLGVLNGLIGAIPEGLRIGYGYITAEYDDHDELVGFKRTVETTRG